MSLQGIGSVLVVGGALTSVFALRRGGEVAGTVPVAIDAIRDFEGVQIARATYFVVTEPLFPPDLELAARPVAVLPLDGQLILTEAFDSSAAMVDLFDGIEITDDEVSIEISDVWIPTIWFSDGDVPDRGTVYRVPAPLFVLAYAFRNRSLSATALLDRTDDARNSIVPAPRETEAYAAWASGRIDVAREALEANPERRLQWSEPDDPDGVGPAGSLR